MATYCGLNDSSPDLVDYWTSGPTLYWRSGGYTCPGSGTQVVQELSAYCRLNSGSAHIRLGVYNTSGTLLGYGTSEVAVSSSLGWQGHMSESAVQAVGGGSLQLTGGVNYILAVCDDQASIYVYYGMNNVASAVNLKLTDYTGGLPSSLPSPDATVDNEYCIRCGVDPALSAKAIPPRLLTPQQSFQHMLVR